MILLEAIREARKIPSLEELAIKVDDEIKKILKQEGKKILRMGNHAGYESIVDIATGITNRIILPYLLTHKLCPYEDHGTFLGMLDKLEKIKDRGERELVDLDISVDRLLEFLDDGLREAYEMLYQGCCDIHFQRIYGVFPKRKDNPGDYVPSSDVNRPGRFACEQTVGFSEYLNQEPKDDNY